MFNKNWLRYTNQTFNTYDASGPPDFWTPIWIYDLLISMRSVGALLKSPYQQYWNWRK